MLSQRSTMAWADALPVFSSVIISALISRSAWKTRFAFMVLLPPSDPEPEVAPPLLVEPDRASMASPLGRLAEAGSVPFVTSNFFEKDWNPSAYTVSWYVPLVGI